MSDSDFHIPQDKVSVKFCCPIKASKTGNHIFSKSKSGKLTDLTKLKKDQTINMMQMASIVGTSIE